MESASCSEQVGKLMRYATDFGCIRNKIMLRCLWCLKNQRSVGFELILLAVNSNIADQLKCIFLAEYIHKIASHNWIDMFQTQGFPDLVIFNTVTGSHFTFILELDQSTTLQKYFR